MDRILDRHFASALFSLRGGKARIFAYEWDNR